MSTEARDLRAEVSRLADTFEAARLHDRLLRFLVVGFIALVAVGIVSGTTFGILLFNEERAAERGRNQIADCIVPTGKCFQQSQQRTQKVVGQIVDGNHNGKIDTQEILDAIKRLEAKTK